MPPPPHHARSHLQVSLLTKTFLTLGTFVADPSNLYFGFHLRMRGPSPGLTALREQVHQRAPGLPLLTHRLAFQDGSSWWEPDPDFDATHHVQPLTTPDLAPVPAQALLTAPPDTRRPRWGLWLHRADTEDWAPRDAMCAGNGAAAAVKVNADRVEPRRTAPFQAPAVGARALVPPASGTLSFADEGVTRPHGPGTPFNTPAPPPPWSTRDRRLFPRRAGVHRGQPQARGEVFMAVRLAVLDLDGTLLRDFLAATMVELLILEPECDTVGARLALDAISAYRARETDHNEAATRLHAGYAQAVSGMRVATLEQAGARAWHHARAQLFPHTRELIALLRSHGLSPCLLSGSPHEAVTHAAADLGLDRA